MKKTAYIITVIAIALLAASCQKEQPGATATVAMAGEWVVAIDGVDASGNITEYGEDFFGVGTDTRVWTFNTAENDPTKMFLDDIENAEDYVFWEYKVPITCDQKALTFSANGVVDMMNGCTVTITGGKITLNGAKTPSGMPADKIEYYIVFSDDPYVGTYYDKLHVHGYRYTGFDADGI